MARRPKGHALGGDGRVGMQRVEGGDEAGNVDQGVGGGEGSGLVGDWLGHGLRFSARIGPVLAVYEMPDVKGNRRVLHDSMRIVREDGAAKMEGRDERACYSCRSVLKRYNSKSVLLHGFARSVIGGSVNC